MPGAGTRGGRGAPSPQFQGFVAEIVGLARGLAPDVAEILDPDGRVPEKPWSGPADRGLRLCASMLKYARAELADDVEAGRLDRAIAALVSRAEASIERDV